MTLRSPEDRETLRKAADIRKRERAARPKRAQPTAPGQRVVRERDPAFLAWLRRLSCVGCSRWGSRVNPIEAAHVRYSDAKVGRLNPGMQRKPSDRWAVPLCRYCHQLDQHAGEERAFWTRLGIDPGKLCPELYSTFKANGDGAAVIRRYAAEARSKS